MKRTALVCLLVGLLPAAPAQAPAARVPSLLSLQPRKPAPGDGELRRLLIARRNAAVAEMRILARDYGDPPRPDENGLTEAVYKVVISELDLAEGRADQVAVLEQYVDFLRSVEHLVERQMRARTSTPLALERARYQRLDAEIWLHRVRHPPEKPKP
jgi:hypothetical protein